MISFKDFPSDFIELSDAILTFLVDLSGRIIGKCGRNHPLFVPSLASTYIFISLFCTLESSEDSIWHYYLSSFQGIATSYCPSLTFNDIDTAAVSCTILHRSAKTFLMWF